MSNRVYRLDDALSRPFPACPPAPVGAPVNTCATMLTLTLTRQLPSENTLSLKQCTRVGLCTSWTGGRLRLLGRRRSWRLRRKRLLQGRGFCTGASVAVGRPQAVALLAQIVALLCQSPQRVARLVQRRDAMVVGVLDGSAGRHQALHDALADGSLAKRVADELAARGLGWPSSS